MYFLSHKNFDVFISILECYIFIFLKIIFCYRLSRARRCSENAFGILGARFQIFRAAMRYDPDDATRMILACYCIHNMLQTEVVGRNMYTSSAFFWMKKTNLCAEFNARRMAARTCYRNDKCRQSRR